MEYLILPDVMKKKYYLIVLFIYLHRDREINIKRLFKNLLPNYA